ncbi:hypothetical protein WG901_17970 [Novosphingobium sp. PS1R-30]|uniref:2'-5' RNA ligase n=1 Tax=Novosphingobium anseongense TaxID=3133436 RepID=A0ABU8S0N3_9SPHN
MARLPWMSKRRPREVLHWTVLPEAPEGQAWPIETILHVLAALDAAPFTLVFDRAKGQRGGTAEIVCRRTPRLAGLLVRTLLADFARAGLERKRKARPHVTLDYAWQGEDFDTPIEPIVWEVDRLLLIESVTGKSQHVGHGEWPLVPRQGTLFPLRSCDREAAGLVMGL